MFAKTRSSGSGGTAQLKDLILPKPIHTGTCGSIENCGTANTFHTA